MNTHEYTCLCMCWKLEIKFKVRKRERERKESESLFSKFMNYLRKVKAYIREILVAM